MTPDERVKELFDALVGVIDEQKANDMGYLFVLHDHQTDLNSIAGQGCLVCFAEMLVKYIKEHRVEHDHIMEIKH